MSIVVTWVTDCEGCSKRIVKESRLSTEEYGDDTLEEGWPGGWMRVAPDDGETEHLFFHSHECYEEYLEKQGKLDELERFRKGVWMA